METISNNDGDIKLILVKNPTGFNQVLSFLLSEQQPFEIVFLINDNLADGTDISWLWDVDFETLIKIEERIKSVYVGGKRAEDIAVRLKYSGFNKNKIIILKDLNILLNNTLLKSGNPYNLYILPTYTAMLEARKILKKKFKLKEFWK